MTEYDTDYWLKCLRDPGWVGTPLVNKQMADHFEAKLKQANAVVELVKKCSITPILDTPWRELQEALAALETK